MPATTTRAAAPSRPMHHMLQWLLLAAGVVGTGCSAASHPAAPLADPELSIAATALARFAGPPDGTGVLRLTPRLEGKTALFPDSTVWIAATDGFGFSGLRHTELVARCWSANRQSRSLERPLPVPGWRVEFVQEGIPRQGDGRTIYRLSRVGLAASGDSALIAMDAICGSLCGRGELALYVRGPGGWDHAATLQIIRY